VIGPHASPIMRVIGALVTPFVLMFGIYVTAHGHDGPGGGFAGGVIMAVAVVVVRMVLPTSISHRLFPPGLGVWLMVAGVGLFVAVGLVTLAIDGQFLDYDAVNLPLGEARERYYGILVVEVGVAMAVMGAMVSIVDLLGATVPDDDTDDEDTADIDDEVAS
jgi:multicomponent Na+:H+ antiporter subunit B